MLIQVSWLSPRLLLPVLVAMEIRNEDNDDKLHLDTPNMATTFSWVAIHEHGDGYGPKVATWDIHTSLQVQYGDPIVK